MILVTVKAFDPDRLIIKVNPVSLHFDFPKAHAVNQVVNHFSFFPEPPPYLIQFRGVQLIRLCGRQCDLFFPQV